MAFLIRSLDDLEEAATYVLEAAAGETLFLFYGEMGAGKTTLIRAICAQLGVESTVSSPTFSLVNEYAASGSAVYHFDLYRLRNEAEALDFGIEDYLDSGTYCLIEWPEKLGRLLPERFLKIDLRLGAGHSRVLSAETVGACSL